MPLVCQVPQGNTIMRWKRLSFGTKAKRRKEYKTCHADHNHQKQDTVRTELYRVTS